MTTAVTTNLLASVNDIALASWALVQNETSASFEFGELISASLPV